MSKKPKPRTYRRTQSDGQGGQMYVNPRLTETQRQNIITSAGFARGMVTTRRALNRAQGRGFGNSLSNMVRRPVTRSPRGGR